MTLKALCVCGHTKTDHKKIQQHYLGVYSECDFDTCNCLKFVDSKTGQNSTYKTTYRQQRTIRTLADMNPMEINYIKCKKCHRIIKSSTMNKHIRSHILELANGTAKQEI